MKWGTNKTFWLCFAATQLIGFVSAYSANVHIDPFPLVLGLVLLFPGDLITSITDRRDSIPGRAGEIALVAAVVLINAIVWFGIHKLLRSGERKTPPPNSITGR